MHLKLLILCVGAVAPLLSSGCKTPLQREIARNGYTPFAFPRDDWRPGAVYEVIDRRAILLESHQSDFLPADKVKRYRGEGEWQRVLYKSSVDATADVSYLNPALGGDALSANLSSVGLRQFTITPGPMEIESLALNEVRRYLNSKDYAGRLDGGNAPHGTWYLIVEVISTNRLEYDFAASRTSSGELTAPFVKEKLGIDVTADTSVTLEESRKLTLDRPLMLGYKAVAMNHVYGMRGAGEELKEVTIRELDPEEHEGLSQALWR